WILWSTASRRSQTARTTRRRSKEVSQNAEGRRANVSPGNGKSGGTVSNSARAAMRGLEGVKKLDRLLVEWRGMANPGGGVSESAHAAMRGLTRHFRAAFARKCSVCPRIAPKDQSGRHRSVATTVHCEEFGPTRSPLRFFHIFL